MKLKGKRRNGRFSKGEIIEKFVIKYIYILFPRGNKFYNAKRARDPRRVYFVEESGENQRRAPARNSLFP